MSDNQTLPKYVLPSAYSDPSEIISMEADLVKLADSNSQSRMMNDFRNANNNLFNTLNKNIKSIDDSIQRQNDVINVIDTEKARLDHKMSDINSAHQGKQRASLLNESYRLRYNQYIKLFVVAISTLLLFVLLSLMSESVPFIPSSVFNLLSIIVVSGGLIIFYYLYTDLLSRNNTYYNEINLAPPVIGNTEAGNVTIAPHYSKFGNFNICIDSDCCATGTEWDAQNGVCVPIKNTEHFSTNEGAMANEPYEFSNYSVI